MIARLTSAVGTAMPIVLAVEECGFGVGEGVIEAGVRDVGVIAGGAEVRKVEGL